MKALVIRSLIGGCVALLVVIGCSSDESVSPGPDADQPQTDGGVDDADLDGGGEEVEGDVAPDGSTPGPDADADGASDAEDVDGGSHATSDEECYPLEETECDEEAECESVGGLISVDGEGECSYSEEEPVCIHWPPETEIQPAPTIYFRKDGGEIVAYRMHSKYPRDEDFWEECPPGGGEEWPDVCDCEF